MNPTSPAYTGAKCHSAVEAEASGLIWAHAWLIQSGFLGREVHMCFDSQIVGYGASGEWTSHTSCEQIGRLRELAQLYRQVRRDSQISYDHVKAHSGQPANELVDALTRACQDVDEAHTSPFLPPTNWSPLFSSECRILEWAWWIVKGVSGSIDTPMFRGEHFKWDQATNVTGLPNIEPIEAGEDNRNITEQTGALIQLQVATFNVLSLNRRSVDGEDVETCRAAMLRQQLEYGGYHIIGLQETRSNCSTTFIADDYVRVVGGSEGRGARYGCEIWLARRLAFGTTGETPLLLDHKKITVLFAEPRLLMIRIQLRGTSLIVVSGHAPHEADTAENKDEWWSMLDGEMKKHSRSGRPILLGDFNARVGNHEGQVVGSLGDAEFNDNGERLMAFCSEHQLWIPSTFDSIHSGQIHTWVHPKGHRARIDYVLLDQQFRNCVSWSSCDPEIQVANSSIDHTLVGLGMSWREDYAVDKGNKRIQYDWEAMHTTNGRRMLQQIVQSLPEVPWQVDVHSHWQLLENHLHQGLGKHFPAKRRPPRAELFTQKTWDALGKRKLLKNHLNTWDEVWDAHRCRCGFKAWKDGMPISSVGQLFYFENCTFLVMRQLLLQAFRFTSKEVRSNAADDKAEFISKIGTEASQQNNTEIFATLKKLRVGAGFRKRALTPLPMLHDNKGAVLQSWEQRDDRWREHCASMEAGVLTSTSNLLKAAQSGTLKRIQQFPDHDLQQVPSLRDLEGAFGRIRPRKAPGIDGLRSDLCKLTSADLAWKFHSLLTKMVTTYSEPLQMKGGVLVASFKGGSTGSIENYRSLLLSSHVGKALRRTIRPKLVELYTQVAPSLHVSVKVGGNVMHASHSLRSFLSYSKQNKLSSALLFVDVKSAYYRVIRQLASNLTCSDADIAKVMRHFDLEPDAMHDLLEELKEKSALKEAGADMHQELLLEELLQNTWFTTCTRRHVTESLAGTRPGDGLADVVFSFVFHRLLKKVHLELQAIQQWDQVIHCEEVNIAREPPRSQGIPPMVEVVWADDLAFALNAPTAEEAIHKIRTVAQHLFFRHGMQPNMARNKTEIMLHLQGAGSRQVKKDIYNCEAPVLHIDGVPSDYAEIKLTGAYKHLGHRLHLGDSIYAEIKARTGQANSVYRQYRRQVFQNPRLPLPKRRYLFQSLVLSILRYNMGTWPRLTGKCWTYFQSRVMAMYRGLARTTVKENDLRYWNNDKILAFVELPSPAVLLHDSRLRYSLSLIRSGPQHLWSLLTAEREWLSLLRESIDWMQSQLTGYGPDRYGNQFAPDWNQWFREQPQAIKGWISKAVRHDVLQQQISTQWGEWHHDFLLECQSSGLQIDFPWTTVDIGHVNELCQLEACLSCGQIFRGRGPWSVHAFRKHGRINWRRRYISGSRCEACLKEFFTETRLLQHLNYSHRCAMTLRRNMRQVDVQPGRTSKREVKDRLMKVPAHRAEGPSQDMQTAGHYDDDPDLDDEFMEQLQDCVDAIHAHSAVEDAVMMFKQIFMDSNNAFSTLCYTFRCFMPHATPDGDDPRTTKQRSVLQMVQDQLRLRWFFKEEDIEMAGPLPSAEDLRGNAWKFCHVDRRLKKWTITRHDPKNVFSDFVVVHLFAGERRLGDLESFLEEIPLPPRATRVIISVDIIYDRQNADLSKLEVQQTWLGFIARGLVAVLYTGPPCETWSSARALGGIAGYTSGDNGPRMLRTSEWPSGLKALRLREARQVLMANILLTFSLLAMLFMLRAQRLAVLEHPSKPEDAWKPSIWRLHVVSILLGHERVRLHHIQQGRFGGHSPKPTSLLVVSPDQAAIESALRRYAITPLPKAVQMGKKDGEYGTAKLKNYPPLLCQSLACMATEWAAANFEVPATEKSDIDFLAYVAHLRCGYNLSACRGQDYASN